MTEGEARERLSSTVPRETFAQLERYEALLRSASTEQNLIAASTFASLWARHLLDSAQLLSLAPEGGLWVDLGTGAGLPGMVVAILSDRPVVLIEPRAKRCAFLASVAETLALGERVSVIQSRAETAPPLGAAVISARAVAPLVDLIGMGIRHATASTVWLLPKGRSAASEVAIAETSWQIKFKLVPSLTDSEAAIVVATGVIPGRKQRP